MRSFLIAVAALTLFAAGTAQAKVAITVDKDNQQMTVAVDGVERYRWPVSSGLPSYETPNGSFRTFRMEEDHYSKEFDDAPMPHSIFFTKIGHAIHGTDSVNRLGSPASHGCVRLSRENAAKLFALVKQEGVLNTTVTLSGSSQVALARNPRPRGNTAVARRAPLPQYEQQYGSAGDPIVITPPQQRVAAAGAGRRRLYLSRRWFFRTKRVIPHRGRRAYDTQAYQQQRNITTTAAMRRRRRATTISHGRLISRADCSPTRTSQRVHRGRNLSRPSRSPAGARVAPSAATVARRRAPSCRPPSRRRRR